MSHISFTTSYSYGEYFSPIDIISIMIRKIKIFTSKNSFFILPGVIVFFISLALSITTFPFFGLCIIYRFLNDEDAIDCPFLTIVFKIFAYLTNIVYLVAYCIYKTLNLLSFWVCILFQNIPPKVNYLFPVIYF